MDDADAVVTLRNYYRRKPSALRDAESNGIPIYVLKTNTILQMENLLASLFDLEADPSEAALRETAEAIGLVQASRQSDGAGSAERLHPAPAAPDGGAQQPHVAAPAAPSRTVGSSCCPTRSGRGADPPRQVHHARGIRRQRQDHRGAPPGRVAALPRRAVVVTGEPGGTPLGDEVRRLVLHVRDVSDDLDPRADALLYAAARAQHTARVIQPALERGEHVISARYLDSSLAYQGVAYGNDLDEMRRLQRFATYGLLPDLTILIDVPVEVGLGRKRRGPWNRFEDAEDVRFFEKVRARLPGPGGGRAGSVPGGRRLGHCRGHGPPDPRRGRAAAGGRVSDAERPLTLHTAVERPDLWERGIASDQVWPEYNLHGDVVNQWWGLLDEELADYQFVLYDEEADVVVAEGHTAPMRWDGDDAHLPDGFDATIVQVFVTSCAPASHSTRCARWRPRAPRDARRRGLAVQLLDGDARDRGASRADPLRGTGRPSWKERYPLTPIERYVTWRRDDGELLDPWMRVHERLGARSPPPLPRSLRITGSVADWECWTAMAFPESGDYVFPEGLRPCASIATPTSASTGSPTSGWCIRSMPPAA